MRRVPEPSIPPFCITLKAALRSTASTIAPEDESKPDTIRIQHGLDACPAGKAVVLEPDGERSAFLSGPLDLRRGVTLVISKGATLYASRNPRDYDLQPGVCGTITEKGHGCRALINGNNVEGAAVMGDGAIDGRGGEKILGQSITWWELADQARKGGNQNNPRIMILNHCDNFTLYRITLRNSPNFHVSYSNGNGFTVWGVKIWAPQKARNTDGIDPGNSTNVTIAHSFIHTGDDQVAIKAGHGAGATTHMTIAHNHFYTGHGMSIGSETDGGASAIRVTDLSIDGADNGIRIKSNSSRGGLVHDVTYEDVCIRNTKNPIYMDTNYSFFGEARDKLPVFTDISLRNVRIEGGGKVTLNGFDAAHRLGMTFDNVFFGSPASVKVEAKEADIRATGFNLSVSGPGVRLTTSPGARKPLACESRFPGFPQ
ncbi:MAG: glycoside hydrolase [Acidobacteriota bacterium]|nr:glycoside hydrolase [Acidobacteriota bacterium]